jgi:hypothetical protein
MTLSDYMSAEKFPATSQSGLSAKDQLFLDALNHDQLEEYIEEGGKLSPSQKARWKELREKVKFIPILTRELRQQEKEKERDGR